jgi:hypothetical protein
MVTVSAPEVVDTPEMVERAEIELLPAESGPVVQLHTPVLVLAVHVFPVFDAPAKS